MMVIYFAPLQRIFQTEVLFIYGKYFVRMCTQITCDQAKQVLEFGIIY